MKVTVWSLQISHCANWEPKDDLSSNPHPINGSVINLKRTQRFYFEKWKFAETTRKAVKSPRNGENSEIRGSQEEVWSNILPPLFLMTPLDYSSMSGQTGEKGCVPSFPHSVSIYCGPATFQALAKGWSSRIRPDLGPHRALAFLPVICLSHTVFPRILALFPSIILGESFPSASGVQDSSSYE